MEKGFLGTDIVCQVGLVVRDVEATGKAYADFFGVEVPPVVGSGEDSIVKGEYNGAPSSASCKMMFFDAGQLQIELIEPDEKPSVWRDILEEKGEGLHHIAFQVKDSTGKVKSLEAKGIPLMQKGNYGNGSGCYAYVDAREQLKLIVELLESF